MPRSSSGAISLPASPASSPATTRGRCKSESDSKASMSHKLKKKLDFPASPLSKTNPLIDICNTSLSDTVLTQTKDSKPSKTLKKCPCGQSSGGHSWLLKCTSCTQTWHSDCANLKGKLPKSTIDSLDMWQCPWCYSCPMVPPSSHRSLKTSSALQKMAISAEILTKIEDTVKLAITNSQTPNLKSIESQLLKLSEAVETYSKKEPMIAQPPSASPEQIESIIEEPTTQENTEPPSKSEEETFLSEEEAQMLKTFLDSETFVREGGREVVSYGATYKYMGAKSTNPKPVPEQLQPILDKINFGKEYSINQILVNKFEGPSSSLAKHSDNEYDINPSSDIFTISLGDSATVVFSEKNGENTSEITVGHRSMYSMTRSSQNLYNHHIAPNPLNTLRYSITMRCIHWTYLNSLYAIDDSNFGHIKFGEGRGTIGKSTPGTKEFAACVEDIKPEKTMSFKNIVAMCGTNNLKIRDANVVEIYKKYKGKLEEIRKRSPKCNIFVCPVLPSRDHQINNRVFEFNGLLFDDLVHSNLNITLVRGLDVFLDNNLLLKAAFHDKRTASDVLHINSFGYSALVKCIKTALFGAKTKKSLETGRQSSGAAWGNPRH